MRRSLVGLLTIVAVLLAANLVVQIARPAQAQVYSKTAPYLVGISSSGNSSAVFRLWSDGTLEANDAIEIYSPELENWKGWKTVK